MNVKLFNMKVVCYTYDYEGPYSSFTVDKMLTIGEWYEATDKGFHYTVYFTDGSFANLAKAYFKTLDEIREEKLEVILN